MFTEQDLQQLARRGTPVEVAEKQLTSIATGFPYLKLQSAASVENGGILSVTDDLIDEALADWAEYVADNHRITKFVPASGAASRMFKNLFAFLDSDAEEPTTDFEKIFFNHITFFAFSPCLVTTCQRLYGLSVEELIAARRYKDVVTALLFDEGMRYGKLPKGLLEFHACEHGSDAVRTPLEEHLVEAAYYAADAYGRARIHFTVSPEHRQLFIDKVNAIRHDYEQRYGVMYDVSYSEQLSSTDTIAANPDGTPFHDAAGNLVFRPGGHGALIENLSRLVSDVVFVKNIDNVVPDHLKEPTIRYKKTLAGILVRMQATVFDWLRKLDSGAYTDNDLLVMLRTLEKRFCCYSPWFNAATYERELSEGRMTATSQQHTVAYLRRKFNRPMRVCGMVRNVGEPGGGPFVAYNSDGTTSLQILESSQIDMSDARSAEMFSKGTHFNPVDLVCAIRDYNGMPFDLTAFTDPATGFVSHKSKDGRDLLALELPGLWNGAMSDWLTMFVEVPLETFDPVKTVNDLLRPQHQPADKGEPK